MAGGDRSGAARTADGAEQPQVLIDGEQWGQGVELGRVAEAGGAFHSARARAQQAGADLQQGGFARTIGPDDGDDLAPAHRQIDCAEHGAAAPTGADVGQTEHDRMGCCGR